MTLWKSLANKWRIKQSSNITESGKDKINDTIEQAANTIRKNKTVPSAMDAIFNDNEDDDDW